MVASAPFTSDSAKHARFSPEQYIYLSENKMLGTGRTELIRGEIIQMCAQYDSHAYGVTEMADALRVVFPKANFWTRVQMTLRCGEEFFEPDVAIVKGVAKPQHEYMTAAHAVLVVEVSDTTLVTDTTTKMSTYAASRVPEYWVLDVNARKLIVHRDPTTAGRLGARYKSITVLDAVSRVATLAMPKKSIRVGKLLA